MMDLLKQDTIVAIATPIGRGAIGMVRLSGPKAHDIVKSTFRPFLARKSFKNFKLIRGEIVDHGLPLDDVIISFMPHGKSYTGEAMCEIFAHGNHLILNRLVEHYLQLGGRLAQPGEFTYRSYMNGKMDLVQAEAVSEVILACSDAGLKIAQNKLRGDFSKEIEKIREKLLLLLVHTEASIDFSTEDIDTFSLEKIKDQCEEARQKIKSILNSYKAGKLVKDGVFVAIVGKPNVGKSSLLNAILSYERAIVSDEPGTTRDTLEEERLYQGIMYRFIDTAGIRQAGSVIEQLGIDRALQKIESSDIILLVLDRSSPLDYEDRALMDKLMGKNSIVVINKTDLNSAWKETSTPDGFAYLETSALTRDGISELLSLIYQKTVGELPPESIVLTSLRHKEALKRAADFLNDYKKGIDEKLPLEFGALDLRCAVIELEKIIGKISMEDVYDAIFSSFCIGK